MEYMNIAGMGYGWSFGPVILLLALWSVFWKGLALWHSARRQQGWWFIILLVVNTIGILEIVYLFLVLKLKSSELIPKNAVTSPSRDNH